MKLEETYADFSFIQSLPGKKLFLKGNHDYWWGTKTKVERYLSESGFDSISLVFNSAAAVENYAVCGTRGWFYDAEDDADKKVLTREIGRLNMSLDAAEKPAWSRWCFCITLPFMPGRAVKKSSPF